MDNMLAIIVIILAINHEFCNWSSASYLAALSADCTQNERDSEVLIVLIVRR